MKINKNKYKQFIIQLCKKLIKVKPKEEVVENNIIKDIIKQLQVLTKLIENINN
jgi:hypothetical protein